MNATFLLIILVLLIVLVVVVAYNMYQENVYRKKIRSQFGHSDQDTLLQTKTKSVRDGQTFGLNDVSPQPLRRAPTQVNDVPSSDIKEETKVLPESDASVVDLLNETSETVLLLDPQSEEITEIVSETAKEDAPVLNMVETENVDEAAPKPTRALLLELDDLAQNDLLWFDKRFDYMGYVSLYEAQELNALPRLSSGHRFQIVGCTMDGRFQAAEPIPGVLYQAFAIGLQGVSRSGLASIDELNYFAKQVKLFAQKIDGEAYVVDANEFLQIAKPLDELCARVDQTIAIHAVSRANVLGVELKSAIENEGFCLSEEGVFELMGDNGDVKYTITALDGSPFTEALLASQPYKGFSLLFDITRVPNGESDFDSFMRLAVRLSGHLDLELVDDQVRRVSTDWLKEVRRYVGARQEEMERVGIYPASPLAKRLFS